MTEKYESKQQQIHRPAEQVWAVLADFNNLTPLVADRVEGWSVEGDECTFNVKGMPFGLRMVEKVPGKLIKIEASDSSPVGFTLWVQMQEPGRNYSSTETRMSTAGRGGIVDGDNADGGSTGAPDTRMRLVLHAEMNMMIKMMIGSRLQGGIDSLAQQIAGAFNAM